MQCFAKHGKIYSNTLWNQSLRWDHNEINVTVRPTGTNVLEWQTVFPHLIIIHQLHTLTLNLHRPQWLSMLPWLKCVWQHYSHTARCTILTVSLNDNMLTSLKEKVTGMTLIMCCNRYKSWIVTRFIDAVPHSNKLVLFKAT